MDYTSQVNAPALFLIVGAILLFILILCMVFLVRSYRAGIAIGMDPKLLKKTVITSAVFTILPSVGILVGVITLSGTLGIPLSWMRLSVVGALQYELSVAEIAAEAIGLSGLKLSELSIGAYTTISLVMTVGILGGGLCTIFFLGRYLKKVYRKPKTVSPATTENASADIPEENGEKASSAAPKKKNNLGSIAMVAMFIGLCTAYISSYIGELVHHGAYQPLFTAGAAGLIMAVFTAMGKKFRWLEDFDVALSMLLAMGAVCVLNQLM